MYGLNLTESYVAAQTDAAVLETTVGGCLRAAAARWPDAEAIVEICMDGTAGRRWNYAQLLADSVQLVGALASRFAKGDKVCVWSPNTPEWVLLEYACGLAGIVLVTANPAYQAAELRYVLEQSGAVALFMVPEYRGNPMAEIAVAAVAGNDLVREVVDLGDHGALFRADGVAALPEVLPRDAAQIQYTSGTTGFPKGAVLTHRGLTNNARFYARRMGATPDSVWPLFMPLFHTAGCAMGVLGAVQTGLKLLVIPIFDPVAILKLVGSEGITAMLGVPTMLVALVQVQKQMGVDVSGVNLAGSGGSMVAPDLVRAVKGAFGCDFVTVYGQTESSPLITMHYHDDTIEDICNSVGQPMPQTEVSIRSMDDNTVTPIDVVGEICVRGYTVMDGYHNNAQATAKAIDGEGWLHSGDLGAMDARGYVRVTGRVKEMIIRGGENLFPAEIENVLLDHAEVAEVAVVGVPDAKWGEVVACFVRPSGDAVDVAALRAHCRAHMAAQKTPSVWVQVAGYPLTGSGKIQKFKLAEDFVAGIYRALEG
jgi:fatty-acyl-CoA synthase